MKTERLDRDQWIDAGLEALTEKGVEGVRVEPLARALGVTKGSFYWHFKDRADLLWAVIEAWEDRYTLRVIDRLGDENGGKTRLWALMRESNRLDTRLERAVRSWAVADLRVAEVVARVDGRRFAYLIDLLRTSGFDETRAESRAQLIYCATIGRAMIGLARTDAATADAFAAVTFDWPQDEEGGEAGKAPLHER